MKSHKALFWSVLGCLAAPAALAIRSADAQVIHHIEPPGVPAGVEVRLTVRGLGLAEPTQVLLPEATVSSVQPGEDGRTVRLTVLFPDGTGPRLVGLRLATTNGISNLKPLVVDDLPVVGEREPNDSPRTAQPIPLNVAIAAAGDNGRRDYYRVRVRGGQYVAVEVIGRRLDSDFDPQVRILDSTGKHVLAAADDTPGLWQDCRVHHVFAKDGDYLIEVSDVRLQGGQGATYWLRVGELPDASFTLPMAVPRGKAASVLLLDRTGRRFVRLRGPSDGEQRAFFAAVPARRSPFRGFLPVLVDELHEFVEREPNDTVERANRIRVGWAVNGTIGLRGDEDVYLFRATRGTRLWIQTTSRWLDSPADLTLTVRDLTGRELAFCDDRGVDDAALDFVAPRTGWYALVVAALSFRVAGDLPYRVRVVPYGPDFSLRLEADDPTRRPLAKLAVPRGGSARCWLTVQRRDYGGPVELRAVGLPSCVQLDPLRIPPGVDQTLVTLTAEEDAPLGAVACQLVGYGIADGRVLRRRLDCSAAVAEELGMTFAPRPLAEAGLAVAVVESAPLRLRPTTDVVRLRSGQTAVLEVDLHRTDGSTGPVVLELRGAEQWVDCPPLTIHRSVDRVRLLLYGRPVTEPVQATAVVVARVAEAKHWQEVSSRALRLVLEPRRPVEPETNGN